MKSFFEAILFNRSFDFAMIVTLICSLLGKWLSSFPGFSLVGHLVLALILGMLVQLLKSVTIRAKVGTGFIANKFLRAGIILLGFKLNLLFLLTSGIDSLKAAFVVVFIMLVLNYVFAKIFKVDHTLAMLTACGCSICGAAAVMGVSAPMKAKADQSVLAIAIVCILGTLFTLIEVFIQPFLGFTDSQFGVMAGLSLHEIAHAVAAGAASGSIGMDSAIIAKLSRVLLLAPVALVVGLIEYRKNKTSDEKISIPIPWFMGGFLLASAIGSYLALSENIIQYLVSLAYILLGMAMAALGINVNFKVIIKSGARPFAAAFICSFIIMGISWFIAGKFFA